MQRIKKTIKPYLVSTGLYEIPKDWVAENLSEVVSDLRTGFASGQRDDNGIIQLRMNNITLDGHFDFNGILKVPIPEDVEKFDLQKGDILFNNTNSLDLIGKTAIVEEKSSYTFSNHFTRIRTKHNKVLPYWLYLIFLRYQERAVFRSICNTHVGQSGIGKKELQKLLIYFPKITEQQKIASILSNVDSLIQQTQTIIDQTQRLKKGLMQRLLTKGIGHTKFKKVKSLFGKYEEIPEEWIVSPLKDLGKIVTGNTPSTSIRDYYGNEFLWASPIDLGFSKFIEKTASMLSKKGSEESRKVPAKSVLTVCIGSTIGKVGLAKKEMSTNQQINSIICKGNDPEFAYYQLLFNQQKIRNMANNAAVPILNKTDFGTIKICKPKDVKEQQKIASILSNVDSRIKKHQEYKSKLETLKKGLTQKLLTGQIRVEI